MFGQIDVLKVVAYMNQLQNNVYTKHRTLRVQIFTTGLAERNVAELTLAKQEAEKVRRQHTLEGAQKTLSANTTPDWLKRAVRLALLSPQHSEERVTRERSGKTENHAVPIHLEIEMGTDLRQVVTECLGTPIASPYLL